jgi:hypothetical protein
MSEPRGVSHDESPYVAIRFDFHPTRTGTHTRVVIQSLGDRRLAERVLWTGWIGVSTGDLHGRSSSDCAVMLGDYFRGTLAGDHPVLSDDPLIRSGRKMPAGGPGAPLGATGGTVTQDTLPGMC